ncbi:MAG TPA: ATP-binding protein [Marinospirillum sp.]|uniref:ATP-binding protein n=1 Tax=Marinospirillum sp. TaxID=2183934 RepID=UPI002B47ADEE|nr:ATP-binding protein [Marinospirillum sp.]HKM15186.1 ATP-binding protein [Marinospirillum sp.]
MKKGASIRKQTLKWALLLFISVSSLIAWSSFHDAAHEVEELYDAHLAQQARLISGLLTGLEAAPLNPVEKLRLLNSMEQPFLKAKTQEGHRYESKVVFQVWQENELILRSRNAPGSRLTQQKTGYALEQVDDQIWRVFVLNHPQQQQIIMAEREDVRGELVDKIALRTLLPDLLGVPALALLIWLTIGKGLKPLEHLAEVLRNRDPHSLQALHLTDLPQELKTIQEAINLLLQQLRALREREQRFIADAAHELRTPLTVLSLHSQNALQAKDPQDRKESLKQLQQGIQRTTRIVSQLLTLARLEPESSFPLEKINPLRVSRQVLADLAPLAMQQQIELELFNEEPTTNWSISMELGSLEILLQNLVTNALRHSTSGQSIQVRWQRWLQGHRLEVIDHGCGVSDQQKPLLVQRFYRQGDFYGSGLGLAIVARIVERHKGRLKLLDTPKGGLTVSISFED